MIVGLLKYWGSGSWSSGGNDKSSSDAWLWLIVLCVYLDSLPALPCLWITTSSLFVHGKNIQSILLPSGPSTKKCCPSNVSLSIYFAWSRRPNISSSNLQHQQRFVADRIATFKSSESWFSFSIFILLGWLYGIIGMTYLEKNLRIFYSWSCCSPIELILL